MDRFSSSSDYVNKLRSANIFMSQGKCADAFELFAVISAKYPDYQASKFGKVITMDCAVSNKQDITTAMK